MEGFGQRLRELRGEKTQAEAAQAIGLKASAYSMYEGERREPGFDTLVMIADHYGVSTDYLLGRTECKSPDIDTRAICKNTGLSEAAVSTLIELKTNDILYYDLEDEEEEHEIMLHDWKQRKETFYKLTNALFSFPLVLDYIFLCKDIERNVFARKNVTGPMSIELGRHRNNLPENLKPFLVDPFSYMSYTEYEIYSSLTEIANQMTKTLQNDQGRSNDGET